MDPLNQEDVYLKLLEKKIRKVNDFLHSEFTVKKSVECL